jgi:tight adherence protein C
MLVIAALLFGTSAALLTVQAGRTSVRRRRRRSARPISGRRRDLMLRATGAVHGTDGELRRFIRRRVGGVAGASVAAVMLVWSRPTGARVALAPLLLAGAWQLPAARARARERRRRDAVDLEIVDALGEMVMGVEAGLTLEAVMRLYAERHSTPLATECATLLDRISLGASRDTALAEFVERTPTEGIRMFVAAVRQNQRIGAPLGAVLRQQAATARRRRRQAIEERSATLAMKMVFPTVFCILPALMVVVVGPALVRTLASRPG